jgi:hypothetical protein
MKHFEIIDDLPTPDVNLVLLELTRLLESKAISWGIGQICLNTTVDEPANTTLGVGSLLYDWDNRKIETDELGVTRHVLAKRDKVIHEFDFVNVCDQFKNTVFEEIYNAVAAKYEIGRVRLMKSESKGCLSWHTDTGYRLHYPLKTQEGCLMIIEDEVYHLPPGQWCLTNATLPHTAMNSSKESRIHLVFHILHENDRIY